MVISQPAISKLNTFNTIFLACIPSAMRPIIGACRLHLLLGFFNSFCQTEHFLLPYCLRIRYVSEERGLSITITSLCGHLRTHNVTCKCAAQRIFLSVFGWHGWTQPYWIVLPVLSVLNSYVFPQEGFLRLWGSILEIRLGNCSFVH